MQLRPSIPDILAAALVLVVGAAGGFYITKLPHKPTHPGVLLMGERAIQCLDSVRHGDGSITVTTLPERQSISVATGWVFVESVP